MRRRYWTAGIAALIIATSLAACGGGGGGSKTTTATTPAPTESGSPVGRFTAIATPLVTGNTVDSVKGYRADGPEGWKFRPNFINPAGSSVDVFFEPLAAGANVQSSIAVTCDFTEGVSPAQYSEDKKTITATLPQNKEVQVGNTAVSGVPATTFTYRFESAQAPGSPQLDKEDVVFSSNACNWTLTLSVPTGQREKYRAIWAAFLQSFKLK